MATTAPVDPHTPVIVGVGQINHEGGDAPEPVELLAEAARRAGADSGATAILPAVTSVRVVSLLSRRYGDPGALLAARIGAAGCHTVATAVGGNIPQSLVDRTALEIQRGDLDVALIGGAESWKTRAAYRSRGEHAPWPDHGDAERDRRPSERFGAELTMSAPEEQAVGLAMPVQYYPLFENALRAQAGRPLVDHVARISGLWSRFAAVAATNPHAALRRGYSPEEIGEPTVTNRMVCYPYTKLLNSNNSVDQAAALLMCSATAARSLGVPRDRWVFLHGAGEASDTAAVSHRADFTSSPAIRLAGRAALQSAGIDVDDIGPVDLYSCFPSAVQIGAAELGLGIDRPLTVTGGLTFAGGPWNDYVTHSIATMAGVLRADPAAWGLVTANGGLLTKHAVAVYAAHPPAPGSTLRVVDAQPAVNRLPTTEVVAGGDGPGTVETYTVAHHRDGTPEIAYVALRLADGRRAWATTADGATMAAMEREEVVGRSAYRRDGTVELTA